MIANEKLLKLITERAVEKVVNYGIYKIPVGVSNRRVHVTREDLETLFGKGHELAVKGGLKQPGQSASSETMTVRGPEGEFERVRILGPVRKQNQIEISKTDSFRFGVKALIGKSGGLSGTSGLELVGPKGTVLLPQEAIVALRHTHMTPQQAEIVGVWDKDIVEVETFGERHRIFGDVLIRVSDQFELEMYVDIDEADACVLENNDYVIVRH